jgi:hypothetical protein
VLAKDLKPAIESMLSELQSRQPEYGLGGNVHRGGQNLMAKAICNAKKKHESVNTELFRVISKYSSILHPTFCKDVCDKLSLELKEMVYRNLRTMDRHICVEISKDDGSLAGAETMSYMDPLRVVAHCRPWFYNVAIVGDEFAKLMLRTLYATSRFKISDPGHLQAFLGKELWGTTALKHALRCIEIDVPLFSCEHPAILDRTRYGLAFLKGIRYTKATIIIHLSLSDIIVPDLTIASAQKDMHREFIKTGREMSDEWWVTVHESIKTAHKRTMEDATCILQKTIQHLLPGICKVAERGHTVTLRTDAPTWVFTLALGGPKLELDKFMEDWEICVGTTF